MKKNKHKIYNGDTIDIGAFLNLYWGKRIIAIKIILSSIVIGIIYSFLSPISFKSETTFVPQTSDQNSTSSLGSLASLAGINLNAAAASSLDNYISPLLYDKIIESDEFSVKLLNEKIFFLNGESLTIKEYLMDENSNNFSVGDLFKLNLFNKKNNKTINKELYDRFNFISSEDYNLIKTFREKFSIEANEKQGYIKVSAWDKNAFVSTQLVTLITKNLQSNIISLRTNKIKEQLDYSEEQYIKKQKEFESLQNKLAEFKDSNKNISTAVFASQLQKLESEYQLQQNILISLATEYNNNKIKLNKDTPIFSVLDEVSVPNKKDKPKRKLIVLAFLFLGIIFSAIYVLNMNHLTGFFNKKSKK